MSGQGWCHPRTDHQPSDEAREGADLTERALRTAIEGRPDHHHGNDGVNPIHGELLLQCRKKESRYLSPRWIGLKGQQLAHDAGTIGVRREPGGSGIGPERTAHY